MELNVATRQRTDALEREGLGVLNVVITGFLARDAPRLPARGKIATLMQLAATSLLHAAGAGVILLGHSAVPTQRSPAAVRFPEMVREPPRLIFTARPNLLGGGGGGGGGNRQSGPMRRAHGIGHDALTLRTTKLPRATERFVEGDRMPPALVLDARSFASGAFDQIGLPEGGVAMGSSTGPGSGGGVGTGIGTGIGSGQGPGLGPGSGGGSGGGVYRPDGGVSQPRLLSQVTPRYTPYALSAKIEGSVWLEVVVSRDGRTGDIRVLRSLDAGLDEEAILAVRQWQFEPARLAGAAVSVAVTVVLDFHVR